jgi:hypothetical protein
MKKETQRRECDNLQFLPFKNIMEEVTPASKLTKWIFAILILGCIALKIYLVNG